jgi:peptide/nickel transport system substrate-binding protein
MKLSKKLIVLVLFFVSALVLVGCKKNDKTVLRVGNPGLSGDFVSGFGSSAYDVNVRDLIHGYGTLVETEAGEFVWDTKAVLANAPTTALDTVGNKTYTFKLQQDLKWNNGEKITAHDFVLSVLLLSSKDWLAIADTATAGIDLVGYEEYNTAETVAELAFSGVRLLGDYEFSLKIKEENLPYFYETVMVSASPIDVDTYLPGFEVKDNGAGAYIHDARPAADVTAGNATIPQVIESTIDSPSGQRYQPTVTSGPYQFVSAAYGGAIVELNPNFKTNYEGKKPVIDEVHLIKINQDTDVDQVIAGTVDLVTGVIEGEKIAQAKEAEDKVLARSYMRNGYGLLAMASYYGPTAQAEVRRAVGYLFDRNVFLKEFLGGYGSLVNGPYGEAQWFFQETKEELDAQLTNYTLDEDKANQELDSSTFKFEADGITPFDPAKATKTNGYYRHDADKKVLEINHLGTTENQVTVLIGQQLDSNFWKAGIKFKSNEAEWDTLLQNYYYGSALPESERVYHLFNLATNFYSNYDPFYSWHSSFAGTTNNPGGIADAELDALTEKMRLLEATETEKFKEYFLEFVVRWNELLPNLPLYSNEYYDVMNKKFTGLETGPVWRWSQDICDIKIAK